MSIRFKLTVIAVAVILVANTLLSFVTMHYLSYAWLDEVQKRVQRNLNSARAAYRKQVDTTAAFLQAAALDGNLAAAIAQGDTAKIRGVLGRPAQSASGIHLRHSHSRRRARGVARARPCRDARPVIERPAA